MTRQTKSLTLAHSFPPIAGPHARLLILGSMPGRQSLARQQYYAHPRNAFWYIMGELFEAYPDLPYPERKEILIHRRVAVWDVLQQCHRPGSLDANIHASTEVANDLPQFLGQHPHIRLLVFNGRKAEEAFGRHVRPILDIQKSLLLLKRVPSTSPAHAGLSRQEKLSCWRQAINFSRSNSGGWKKTQPRLPPSAARGTRDATMEKCHDP